MGGGMYKVIVNLCSVWIWELGSWGCFGVIERIWHWCVEERTLHLEYNPIQKVRTKG